MKVWLVEMVDTSSDAARYIVWGNVFSSKKKAMAHIEALVKEAIEEDKILTEDTIVRQNGGREISDIDGRMYYKVCEREIDVVK